MNLDETIVYHMRQSKIEDDIDSRIRHIQIACWLTELKERRLKDDQIAYRLVELKERRLKDEEEEEENNEYYHW